jgi:hypothetical protein
VDNNLAIANGRLANNAYFFGSNTAETIGTAGALGSWSEDRTQSGNSVQPWFVYGAGSEDMAGAGIFAHSNNNAAGGAAGHISHRTILSGY